MREMARTNAVHRRHAAPAARGVRQTCQCACAWICVCVCVGARVTAFSPLQSLNKNHANTSGLKLGG